MKKTITFLLVILSALSLKAQVELIRNGDFTQGVSGSNNLKDIAFWNMDMATPASSWWEEHVVLTSSDTTIYQVIETISADSVLYTMTFTVNNTWVSDKIVAIASVTDTDSTIRTRIKSTGFLFTETLEFKFGFSANSIYTGKKLVIEFDLTSTDPADPAWAYLDNVSLKKVIAGVNSAPVAITGPPQTVKGGDLVTLDASASNDFEGSPLTYKWVSVYPGISLSDKTAVSPTFTAPDVTELTTFEFTLFVSDGQLNSDTVIASVTVSPAGELIRNGGFELFREGSDPASISLLDIAFWNIDTAGVLSGGRYGTTGLRFVNPASVDPPMYQVVKTISTNEATYTLRFSARSSWNSSAIKAIISVSDADTSIRTEINSFDAVFAIDPPNSINDTEMKVYTFDFVIPANSQYVGKKLILEFDNIPYADGLDDGWAELDNVSLIEATSSAVYSKDALNITIYPNPASERIYIQSGSLISKVEIYSVPGKLEKTIENYDIRQVELGDISKGLHFISLTTNSGIITKKFRVK